MNENEGAGPPVPPRRRKRKHQAPPLPPKAAPSTIPKPQRTRSENPGTKSPLCFTYQDFASVMADSTPPEERAERSLFPRRPPQREPSEDEGEVCFRVITTRQPFEKCHGAWDEASSAHVFDDYIDRSPRSWNAEIAPSPVVEIPSPVIVPVIQVTDFDAKRSPAEVKGEVLEELLRNFQGMRLKPVRGGADGASVAGEESIAPGSVRNFVKYYEEGDEAERKSCIKTKSLECKKTVQFDSGCTVVRLENEAAIDGARARVVKRKAPKPEKSGAPRPQTVPETSVAGDSEKSGISCLLPKPKSQKCNKTYVFYWAV